MAKQMLKAIHIYWSNKAETEGCSSNGNFAGFLEYFLKSAKKIVSIPD